MQYWFVLKTKPRQEKRAVEQLDNQGFCSFCPRFICRNGREEVLFPGYIFLNDNESLLPSKVRSTRGVSNFIRFGDKPAMVPETLINAIRLQEKQLDGSPVFSAGQLVEFATGPFKDYQAVYLCDKGEDRSIVLLKLLSASRKVQVETHCLRKS